MNLHPIDLAIIAIYFIINALIGVYVQKKAAKGVGFLFPCRS